MQSRAAAANGNDHLSWVMLSVRATFREDSEFSPAKAVFISQLVLPGQCVDTAESPSLCFLRDLQTTMAGCSPPPAWHNSALAPTSLPEDLLKARFVLVCRDGAQPPLDTFLSPADRIDLNALTQAGQNTGGHRACTAVAQGTSRCAGATCPCSAAATAATRAAAAGDFHTSVDYATSNNSHIIIRLAASQYPSAGATQPLSLPPQSLRGTCGGVPTVIGGSSLPQTDNSLVLFVSHHVYVTIIKITN